MSILMFVYFAWTLSYYFVGMDLIDRVVKVDEEVDCIEYRRMGLGYLMK